MMTGRSGSRDEAEGRETGGRGHGVQLPVQWVGTRMSVDATVRAAVVAILLLTTYCVYRLISLQCLYSIAVDSLVLTYLRMLCAAEELRILACAFGLPSTLRVWEDMCGFARACSVVAAGGW